MSHTHLSFPWKSELLKWKLFLVPIPKVNHEKMLLSFERFYKTTLREARIGPLKGVKHWWGLGPMQSSQARTKGLLEWKSFSGWPRSPRWSLSDWWWQPRRGLSHQEEGSEKTQTIHVQGQWSHGPRVPWWTTHIPFSGHFSLVVFLTVIFLDFPSFDELDRFEEYWLGILQNVLQLELI